MSYLEKASESWHIDSGSHSRWSTIRFFFDFRAHHGLANNLEGLLRSLLFQILKQNPGSDDELRRLEEKYGNNKADIWARGTLKKAFVRTLLQVSANLCILVDGLDEFSESLPELLTIFLDLPSRTDTGHLLKMCLASRPLPILAQALGDRPGLQMQAHNTSAIQDYVFTTMANLGVAAHDRLGLKKMSANIAEKAEGVFLWARFAVMEVVNGYAEGESTAELNQRLEKSPSDMDELYTNIFNRMDPKDREEAQLMFQLVCFAQEFGAANPFDGSRSVKFINLRQLMEAVVIAQIRVAAPAQRVTVNELERFRKRLKAKSGGLLEEVYYEENFETYEFDIDTGLKLDRDERAREHFNKNGGMIILIHRTAQSYLDREGWFSGLVSPLITSPHALWLYVCCKSVQRQMKSYESKLRRSKPANLKTDKSLRSSLLEYASYNLFVHARLLEFRSEMSSFSFLQIISSTLWRHLRKQYQIEENPDISGQGVRLDWDSIDELSDRQPWQIIVEQGLPLCLRDAALKHLYTPPSEGEDISIALLHTQLFNECGRYSVHDGKENLRQLVSCLVDVGAVVRERHIIECLHSSDADVLSTLLASWPKGRIRLRRDTLYSSGIPEEWLQRDDVKHKYTYNGEAVGILW